MKTFMLRTIGWLLAWIVGSFFVALIGGSVVWFIARVFGAEWDYFTYIRGWFFVTVVADFLLDLWRWNQGKRNPWSDDPWNPRIPRRW